MVFGIYYSERNNCNLETNNYCALKIRLSNEQIRSSKKIMDLLENSYFLEGSKEVSLQLYNVYVFGVGGVGDWGGAPK